MNPIRPVGPIEELWNRYYARSRPVPAPIRADGSQSPYSKPTAADRPAPKDFLWRNCGEIS